MLALCLFQARSFFKDQVVGPTAFLNGLFEMLVCWILTCRFLFHVYFLIELHIVHHPLYKHDVVIFIDCQFVVLRLGTLLNAGGFPALIVAGVVLPGDVIFRDGHVLHFFVKVVNCDGGGCGSVVEN